jgi:hypothetical protein
MKSLAFQIGRGAGNVKCRAADRLFCSEHSHGKMFW